MNSAHAVAAAPRTSGFTLIEVLVSTAFVAVTLMVMEALVTSIRMNRDSRVTMTVNQAVGSYLETVYGDWQSALRYRNGDLPPPLSLPGHTWELTVATVDVLTGSPSNTVTFVEGSALTPYAGDVPLKRIGLRYNDRSGKHYVGSVELSRP